MTDAGLAAQIRWYELARAACAARPDLHAAQLAALDASRELARRAPTIEAFTAALVHGGHATALGRAEQHDRFAADLAIARALGDDEAAAAARLALDALAAHPGDAGFVHALGVTAVAAARAADAAIVGEHAARLVEAAIDVACDPDPRRRADHAAVARTSWRLARTVAPGFGVAWLRTPPLRHRLPFGDHAWAPLRELIAAALALTGPEPGDDDLDGAPRPPPVDPASDPPPRADLPADLPVDGWPATAADLATLAAQLAALEAGAALTAARTPLAAALAAARAIAERRDEPALVALADVAAAGVAAAPTPTAAGAWIRWHGAVAEIERTWWHLLVHAALWPLAAAMIAPPATARPAAVACARLLGVDALAALDAPAVARAARRQLVGAGQSVDEDLAIVGPGAPLVAPVRRAAVAHAVAAMEAALARGAAPPALAAAVVRWPDLGALVDHAAATLAAAGAPRGGDAGVVLWGVTVPLPAVDGVVARVPRPRPTAL